MASDDLERQDGPMLDVRRSFHHDLDVIRDDLVRMSGMVTEALARATRALLDGDLATADEIIRNDDAIDALALDIEERCYQLMALQQPMASDLRALITAIRMVAEIERSGDLVANIMKASRRIYGAEFEPKVRGLIERMGDRVHRLFRLSIDAYVERDNGLAAAIDDMDDEVDDLHVAYIQSIFETHETGAAILQVSVQLALVGRFYERIADHAVNIGERVQYLVTGWLPEHTGAARVAQRQSAGTPQVAAVDAPTATDRGNDPGAADVDADDGAGDGPDLAPDAAPDDEAGT
jgi:phosphate transport system protein